MVAGGGGGGSETSMFRLSGSNTIGKALAPDLVKAWLESKGATDITAEARKVPKKDAPETVIHANLDGNRITIEVRPHGSSTAFADLLAGTAEIGMASRAIKSGEAETLRAWGDMRTPNSEHVIGLDGVAVIVNAENPVGALSTAVLRRIFTGEIRDWSEVGGPSGAINIYARDNKSGTFDTFKELVLRGDPLGDAKRFEDSAALETAVAGDRNGIGFVALPYVKTTHALAVNDGESAPLQPTSFSIRTESYPLSRRLYFYSPPQATNRDAKDFITFALSPDGQKVVRKDQFVDLDIAAAETSAAAQTNAPCRLSSAWPGDPNAYCNLRRAAEPLQTSFRFRAGSDTLDTRSIADLRRVLARMEQTPNKQIVLAGFSDNLGAAAGNCALSTARARRVAQALATLGLNAAEVVGFCSELPVRDNSTPEGREQNRRVEIFLR
ncbi:hypothetical protein IP88_10220 [alpha proteobacterium AAP81b]|nr:hypothetical protein IP88_10220 [alpha proteobacterium AAP81b]